jgi:putative tricarboxylic transport membrane protein
MFTRDFVGGVATIAIGAVYLYFSYQLRTSALDDSMGPGGLPRIYGWLLVALGSILIIQAALASRTTAVVTASGEEAKGEWEGQGRKVVYAFGLLAIGIAYLFILETFGYLISIALLITTTALYLGAGFSGRLIAIGIGGAVFLYAMFVAILGVRMPAGILAVLGL